MERRNCNGRVEEGSVGGSGHMHCCLHSSCCPQYILLIDRNRGERFEWLARGGINLISPNNLALAKFTVVSHQW